MSRNWVVNASPLIVLGKIGRIGLIEYLADSLVVPDAVAQEIDVGAEADSARDWLANQGAKYILTLQQPDPVVAAWDLGAGETFVLTYARQHGDFEAIIDDRAARNCAKSLQLRVRGTLGIILLAKQAGLISEVKPFIKELRDVGLHLNPLLDQQILELAGE